MRWVVVLALVSGYPTHAHAACRTPSPEIGPASGSTVPPDPTIYVFAPSFGPPAFLVEGDGLPLAYTTTPLGETTAYASFALHISTAGAHDLAISVATEFRRANAHYVIDPSWRRPPRRPVELSGFVHSQFHWPCDSQDAVEVFPSVVDAAAYRMVWTGPGGESGHVALPPGPVVSLGHMSCLGETIPDDLPERYLYGLEALHADGSVDPPARLVPSTLRSLGPPEDERLFPPTIWHDAPPPANPPAPRPPPDFLWAIFGGGLTGALLGYPLGRARRRRAAAPS